MESTIEKGETGSGSRSLMSDEPKNEPKTAGSEKTNVSVPQAINSML